MRQKSHSTDLSSEEIVKDIRRATRKQYSAEEKIRIVLDGLRGEHSHRRALPPRGHCRGPLLQLVEGVPGSRQAAPGRRHRAGGDQRRGQGPPPRGPGAEGGRRRAGARTAAAQKKHDRGWGRRGMRLPGSEKLEIIRLVEQSHLPVRRTLEKLGIRPATFYRWYDRYRPADQKRWKTSHPGPIASGTASLTMCASGSSTGAGRARAVAARAGHALHRYGKLLCLGSFGLSAAQGARPDHQPGLHRHQGGRRVQGQDHGAQPALADRLHLSQGHRLGLVLSLDHPR